jgi:signal transduction histidine kinase
VGTVLDIDDRRRAFKQVKEQNILLAKTNEELDRFVYSTSHDLRAPLSSILGLIKVTELSNDAVEKANCLVMMKKRVDTLNGFIADIIDYSRNSRLGLDSQKIKLKSMMDEVIDGLKFFEKSQSIVFHVDIPDDFTINIDGSRLKIVLNNLIANAIKYHNYDQAHPSVNIKSELSNDLIIISVTDNGVGIAPEYHDKIFNMFYRASDKSEGSGLGLYIAKEMVEKLNGQIRMESKLDQGTSFFVELPLREVLEERNA